MLVGKYYPNLVTQFIIGCSFYVVSFLMVRDICTGCNFDQYKYYILSLIIIDASFLFFKTKSTITSQKNSEPAEPFDFVKMTENISSDLKTGSIQSISLSSEINDYKITHDISLSDNSSIFSNSDEKISEKENSTEKSNSEISLTIDN